MRKLATVFWLFLLPLVGPHVAAQSSPSVEQGIVTFTGSSVNPIVQFTLTGPQFLMLTGGMRDGNHNPSCTPCVGGQVIRISDIYSGPLSFLPGNLITGNGSQPVYFAGEITTDSPSVTMPVRFGRYPQRIVVPISLTGTLEVHSSPPFGSPHLIFAIPLSLQGNATLMFRTRSLDPVNPRLPVYEILSLTYDFSPPPATDEDQQ